MRTRTRWAASAGVLAALALAVLTIAGWAQRPDLAPPAGEGSRQVVVDGTPIRYRQGGAGPDVLLVHGSPGSVEDWERVFDPLARAFRVTAFDRPGHGYSGGADRPHTPDDNASVALGVIRALGLHDVVYVGHSFGGATGLALAVRNPPEVRAFVIVSTRGYGPVPVGPLYRLLAVPGLGRGVAWALGSFVGPSQVEKGVRQSFGPNVDAIPGDFLSRRIPIWTRPTVSSTLSEERVRLGAALAAMEPKYGEIRKPVVVLCGDADRNRDDAARLSRAIPGARLVLLPGTGHYVQFARPDALVEAIHEAAAAPPSLP